jgi:L-ascorbate metabolism protein UlaG (beta-lactamase superfamily)
VPAEDHRAAPARSAESETCTVTWWGHATVDIRLDGVRLVTDPLLRARVGPLHSHGHRPRRPSRTLAVEPALAGVDAVLLSHLHRDHTDLPSLRRVPHRTKVVAPAGAGRVVRRSVRGTVQELPSGSTTEVGPIRVTATPAVHDGRRDRHGPWAEAVGYLVAGSRSVYFAGDTDIFDGMADLPGDDGIDVALLPVSGWGLTLGDGHMGALEAAEAVALLRPRLAVPVHWGTLRIPVAWRARRSHLLGVADRFAELVAERSPGTTVVVPVPGRTIPAPAPTAGRAS